MSDDLTKSIFTPIRKRVTPTRRRNLARLATYLESLPEDYSEFRMSSFFALDHTRPGQQNALQFHYAKYNGTVAACGTAACAVGHGPSAGLFMIDREMNDRRYEPGWSEYTERVFIGTMTTTGADPLFSWLFGESWQWIDNHHWSAAARIRCFLSEKMNLDEYYGRTYYGIVSEMQNEFHELTDKHRITKVQPLPKDFYTPAMISRMEEGKKLLDLLND